MLQARVQEGQKREVPVCKMFLSMCLGVSPSSSSIDAGAGVLFRGASEAVLLVKGMDFLVMLCTRGI